MPSHLVYGPSLWLPAELVCPPNVAASGHIPNSSHAHQLAYLSHAHVLLLPKPNNTRCHLSNITYETARMYSFTSTPPAALSRHRILVCILLSRRNKSNSASEWSQHCRISAPAGMCLCRSSRGCSSAGFFKNCLARASIGPTAQDQSLSCIPKHVRWDDSVFKGAHCGGADDEENCTRGHFDGVRTATNKSVLA